MNIGSLTIDQAREIAAIFGGAIAPVADGYTQFIGSGVYVRTVTHHYVGELIRVTPGELVLMDASWIPCTDRWSTMLATGQIQTGEVEPYPDGQPVVVSRGAICDVCSWRFDLPRTQK